MAVKKFKITTKSEKNSKPKAAATKKIAAIPNRQTKIEILQVLANRANLSKKEVALVFAELVNLIEAHLKKKGSGTFIVPGTGIKITRKLKKKTKARQMISPLIGKAVALAAKPERIVVKIKALKQLQELVNK